MKEHWPRYQFIIDQLRLFPVDSHEFLCAVDLLEILVDWIDQSEMEMPSTLFAIDVPLPAVVKLEIQHVPEYQDMKTVGAFLRRIHEGGR